MGSDGRRNARRDRPDEALPIEQFVIEREAKTVAPDDLHESAVAAPEGEEISGTAIAMKALLDRECEALHPAAHI